MGFMGSNREVLDFPSGYFGCCGMSRARGHADLCPHRLREPEKPQPDPTHFNIKQEG